MKKINSKLKLNFNFGFILILLPGFSFFVLNSFQLYIAIILIFLMLIFLLLFIHRIELYQESICEYFPFRMDKKCYNINEIKEVKIIIGTGTPNPPRLILQTNTKKIVFQSGDMKKMAEAYCFIHNQMNLKCEIVGDNLKLRSSIKHIMEIYSNEKKT